MTVAAIVFALSMLAASIASSRPVSLAQPATGSSGTTNTTGDPGPRRDAPAPQDVVSNDQLLKLVDQTSWVAPEDTFSLVLEIGQEIPEDAALAIRVYPRVGGRIMFDQSIRGERLGSPLKPLLPATPLASMDRDDRGRVTATLEVSSKSTPEFGVHLSDSGVYPVSVAITDEGGRELAHLITHLVRVPTTETPGPPLAVSVVVPIDAAPAHQPEGTISFDTTTRSSLEDAVARMAAYPDVPVTIDPTPETIQALAQEHTGEDAGLTALRSTSPGRQILTNTYVKLDLGAWVKEGRTDRIDEQMSVGAAALAELLGGPTDQRSAILDQTVSSEALDFLQDKGVEQVVVPQDQLSALPSNAQRVTFTQSFDIETPSGATLHAVASDAELLSRLGATDDPVLNAHLALADLAVLYMDAPSLSRGVALVLDPDIGVDGETLDALLKGLRGRPAVVDGGGRSILGAVTLDDLFRVTDPARSPSSRDSGTSTLTREYSTTHTGNLGGLPDQLDTAYRQLESFRLLTKDNQALIRPLENQLLIACAAGLSSRQRDSHIDAVTTRIRSSSDAILAPADQVMTLTSRSGRIPLTLDNQLPYDVAIEIHLTSEKLDFPEGDTIVADLPANANTRIEIAVEARVSGSFPLDISVHSPDGELLITSTRFTVRSTAISGLGLALSLGAGAFLLIWWVRHFRRVRKAKRLLAYDYPALKDITSV